MKIQNQKFKGWKDELQYLINENNKQRVNGRVTSHKTQADRAKFLFHFFNWLIEKNKCNVLPRNLKIKHVKEYCRHLEENRYSAATIQVYFSFINLFCRWIGKDSMLGGIENYFQNKESYNRIYAAKTDKSWTGNNININEILNSISVDSRYVYVQLLVISAFGLRRKEAICLRPAMCVLDNKLHILDGAKGGKNRVIPIETDYQREALKIALQLTGKTSASLGDPTLNLKQNLSKYSAIVTKHGITKKNMGVTGHGLRVEYIIQFMESRGLIATVRGGNAENNSLEPEMVNDILIETTQRVGHNRTQILTAYSGALPKP